MNQDQNELIKFVNYALDFSNFENNEIFDFEKIFKEARAHQIEELLYYSTNKLGFNKNIKSEFFNDVKKRVFSTSVYNLQQDSSFKNLLDVFSKNNIEMILVKGSVIKDLYPRQELRTMGDYDVLVHREDLDKVDSLFKELGYETEGMHHDRHIEYYKEGVRSVEVHWQLVKNEFLNEGNTFEADIWNNKINTAYNRDIIYTLSHEDMILHLVYHMAGHIITSGFGLRQLIDLAIYSKKYKEEVNWNIVKVFARENKIEIFLDYIFVICKKLFGTDVPLEIKYDNDIIVQTLLDNIFESGVFGRKDKGEQFARALSMIDTDTQSVEKRFLEIIFPKIDNMSDIYSYAKKNKILAPVAWGHHVARGVCNKDFSFKNKLDFIFKSVDTAKERGKFLEKIGLK
ncbi:MAG: nucleotidyltransferase domain-containing protein [Sarcina sp.]